VQPWENTMTKREENSVGGAIGTPTPAERSQRSGRADDREGG
jgi:hypothetical protein